MPKIQPLRTPKPVETEAEARMKEIRAKYPADLPTMAELYRRYGEDWLTFDSALNMRYLAPWPCSKCNSHVARVGNSTCVSCYEDIIVLPAQKKSKTKDKLQTVVEDSDTAAP